MKRIFFNISIKFILIIFLVGSNVYAQNYDVFLLIGQSNMAGRGKLLDVDLKQIKGVWLLNTKGDIEKASNPLNKYSSIRGNLHAQQMSPAYSFGKKLHEVTGRKILLVVNARGGSSIEDWSRGNDKTHFYDEAIRRAREAEKYGKIKAIIWHQGERNSDDPISYLSQLSTFVANLRTDLGSDSIFFVAGEIAQWHKNAIKMNPIIQSIPAIIPYSDYVTSLNASPLKDCSDPHFSRSGCILIGNRYANKVLQYVYGRRKN